MSKLEEFIDKYLSKPNKEGGYKINDSEQEASSTSDLNDLSVFQNHSYYDVRFAAISNPNCTSAHIDKALNDDDREVRALAAMHPNATPAHINKALDDDDWVVRSSAKFNKNYKKFFPNGH